MKKKIISFLLLLCLGTFLQADWTYNAYTGKLDYYEKGMPSGLAGDTLYHDGTIWQKLAKGTAGQFLSQGVLIPAWASIPPGITTFIGLTDTPANYTGAGLYFLRVNTAGNAVEFANMLSNAMGGTGQNSSAWTGVPSVSTGTWSAAATLANNLGGTGQNSSAWTGYPYVTTGAWAADTTLTKSTAGVQINGINGELVFNNGTYVNKIVNSNYEGLAGTDLRIVLNPMNAVVLLPSTQATRDLGLQLEDNPTIILPGEFTNGSFNYMRLNYAHITSTTWIYIQPVNFAVDSHSHYFRTKGRRFDEEGHAFEFIPYSAALGPLKAAASEEAWIYAAPVIEQSMNALYVGLLIDITENSLGGGIAGTYSSLMDLRVGGASKFAVERDGNVRFNSTGTGGVIVGANFYSIETDEGPLTSSIIAQSNAENIAYKSDLRIGLDESLRTLRIMDRDDIASDFAATAKTQPTISIHQANGTFPAHYWAGGIDTERSFAIGAFYQALELKFNEIGIRSYSNLYWDAVTIEQNPGTNFISGSAYQRFLYIQSRVNQSGTAGYAGIYLNVIETAVGTGAKNLIDLRRGDESRFAIDRTGKTLSTIGADADFDTDEVIDTSVTDTDLGMVMIFESTTPKGFVYRLINGTLSDIGKDGTDTGASFIKDNADTYNFYFEGNILKIQNKVGDNKAIKAIFWGAI